MILPSRLKQIVIVLSCLIITSCGGNGCKYPDEIAAGGIWSETQTTVVKPINRNVIASEQGNGEYTLKDGTTEDMADSNLWVPLRSTDGTYAKVEAGKKVKLSVSGSVVLAGYSYNTDITFKDWISYGAPPYSFAQITRRTDIDEQEINVVKIEKERIFHQNGLQEIKYHYYGEDGVKRTDEGELVKIGCDLNLSAEELAKEKLEDNLYVNYAFLYPEKIVFSNKFFIKYNTDANKHINNITKIDSITIDSSNNLQAEVKKMGPGDYQYIYTFKYDGKSYRYHRRLAPEKKDYCYDFGETLYAVDCEEAENNSCMLSKMVCANDYANYSFRCPETIVFSNQFFVKYETDSSKHINNRTGVDTITINSANKLTAEVEKIGPGDYQYIYKFEYNGKSYRYTRKVSSERQNSCNNFEEKLYAIDCEEQAGNSCLLSQTNCTETFNNTITTKESDKCSIPFIDRSFYLAEQLSPVMIYFKKYNNSAVNYSSIGTPYNDDNYSTYFHSPTYALKNRIRVSMNEYKNRFSYGLYQTGSSSADSIKYPGNCRMFPSSIKYAPMKIKKKVTQLSGDTLNTLIAMDNITDDTTVATENKVVTKNEYCSKYCVDLCIHYFDNNDSTCGMLAGMNGNSGTADGYLSDSQLLKFINYSPVDANKVNVSNHEIKNTDCTCKYWGHAFAEVKDKFDVGDLRQKAYNLCTSNGYTWGGLVFVSTSSSNNYYAIKTTNMKTFTIVKMAYGNHANTECQRNTGSTNGIAVGICSPYDRAHNHCDEKTDKCNSVDNCKMIGGFYDYSSSIKIDSHCPNFCEKITSFDNDGNTGSEINTSSFNVVSRIDYYDYDKRNDNPRKSSNIDDQDNSIYYRVNNGATIAVNGYSDIKDGLLAVGGPDIVGITCNDAKIPTLKEDNGETTNTAGQTDLFAATTTFTEADGHFSGCKVKGKYTSMDTKSDISHHLYYNEQKQGILPIKWSTFTAHPGDILPLSITSADSGASPLLVKTNNCLSSSNNKNCYTQLRNGNGLIIVLEPVKTGTTTPAVDEDMYKNPNLWLCHYGVGGSYGSYNPYLYDSNAIQELKIGDKDIGRIDNPRQIHTTTGLTWQCDKKGVAYWFTGYDYKGIKLKTTEENSNYVDTLLDENADDKYPSPHIYKVSELNRIIPDYGREELEGDNNTSDGIQKIDCSADGVPNTIIVGGATYTKASNQLSIIKRERDYVYQYYDGATLMTKAISDVDSATYSTAIPNRLIIEKKENNLITNAEEDKHEIVYQTDNDLTRSTCTGGTDGVDYCYFYNIKYTGEYAQDEIHNLPNCKCSDTNMSGKCNNGATRICSYEKRVYHDSILGAYCSDDKSDLTTDISKSSIVTSITADSCGGSCKVIDNTAQEKEIFTAYGPFAGMNADNVNAIMPAIYDGYHMCRGGTDGKQFIYDTQTGPDANIIFQILTAGMTNSLNSGVERKPLDVYWRLEFTNPTLENRSSYKGSYNSVDTVCPAIENLTPDMMFVDLTNTNEWSSYSSGRTYPQTVLIYKDINGLIKKSKIYYSITYSPWGWSAQLLPEDDHKILAVGETCGLHENCGDGETPDLKIINNSEVKTLIDSTSYSSVGNSTITSVTRHTYEFYYDGKKYTIPEKKVAETTKICNITSQQAWLSTLTTVGEKIAVDTDGEPLGNLGKAPFIVACDNNETVLGKYKIGYTSLSNLSSGTTDRNVIKDLNETIEDGISTDSDLSEEKAFVMKTQNKSFLLSEYFARCTTNWQTPGWMLLNNPGDFSSFNVADSALSGSFIAKPNKTLSWDEVKRKYALEQIWAKHGGIIRNTIYNNQCDEKNVPEIAGDTCAGNCGKMYTNCKTTSNETHTPEFRTFYKSQMIAVKTLANDPINTTDTKCDIVVKNGATELGRVTIQANEPFGQVLPTSTIKTMRFQGDTSFVKEALYDNNAITINGGLQYKRNFFKKTEFHRNFIGAGIVKPEWHFLTDNTTNLPVVIAKDKNIKIEPSSATFYAMGNLSHQGQGYCWSKSSEDTAAGIFYTSLGVIETACTIAGVAAGVATGSVVGGVAVAGTCTVPLVESAVSILMAVAKPDSEHNGKMTPISSGTVAKRQCGTGMAFRVIEVPTFACIRGYGFACTSQRLTQEYASSTTMEQDILQNCISSTSTDYASNATIGTCYRNKTNISSGINESQVALAYTNRYHLNSFKEVKSTDSWSEIENIDEQQCGICLPKNEIEKYNGISYYAGTNYPTIPSSIRNISQCNTYQDNEGNQYTFVTSLARTTPFNKYDIAKQTSIQTDIDNILSTEIHSCASETSNSYSINFSNKENKDAFENIFKKMSIRDENSCIALLETFYNHEIKQANVSEECENAILSNLNNIAKNGCNKLLTYIEEKDGKYYDLYKFNVNQTYTYCKDDKIISDTSHSPINSITRVNVSNSLKDNLFAELTDDSSSEPNNVDSVLEINVHIPEQLKIDGTYQNYEKANVGFAIAGANNDNPMLMYSNFKLDNQFDLNRGYSIRIGNGIVSRNGKYLYYYIQPNDANGNPDPLFEPNIHFNLHAPNPHGKLYVKNYPSTHTSGDNMIEILTDPTIHHFADEDIDGDGNITFTAPDSGTLWFAVLDVDEIDTTTGDSISNERDGKAIIFRDALDLSVDNQKKNVLGTNGGYYMVKGKIQGETFDIMDEMLSMDGTGSGSKVGEWINETLFRKLIINTIRTLLFGSSDFKNITYENILSQKYEGKDESTLTDEQKTEKGKIEKLNKDLKKGLIFQILKIIFSFHLVHILYYMAVIGCVFIFGGKVLLGMQKIDFKTIFKYVLRFSLIALILHPDALKLYLVVFVRTAFALSDGFIMMVASNFTDRVYVADDSSTALSVAFGPVDSVIRFWLKSERIEQLLAILCSSWFGWLSVIVLLLGTVHFIISAVQALVVYIITLMNLFLELALGPLYFALLLFDKTAGKFTQWLKNIGALIAQQTAMFSALAIFATIYYHLLKGTLNFTYCWEPIIKIPVLNIPLFSCWRIAGNLPVAMAELMGDYAPTGKAITGSTGFSPLTALCLYLLTVTMSKFIDKSVKFGGDLFGGGSQTAQAISAGIGKLKDGANSIAGSVAKNVPKRFVKSLGKVARAPVDQAIDKIKGKMQK